ncbi:excisionase family DNA-binding protein [Microbacterium sp. NPDC057407]|uniref:excisionase family DNA-binding protein n=1 Tax=Microbacterium sp. NPDC057407 TaxID=3346120 RepID=UPI003672DFFC
MSYISIGEAAARLGVSQKTVRRYIAAGIVRGDRVGPRLIRVDASSLDRVGQPLAA